ncbi:MAG TPA: nuclear transport factor 2 family protein [Solirubrobacterales bacterium]|nr:nuclear transport factor 2 family protein [Solirubrobacterales bacterium]
MSATRFNQAAAADFAARFAAYWRAPTPERLTTVLADRVRLIGPMTPTTETLEQAQRVFAGLFELIPGLTGEVHRWGATEDGVLIEFTLSGTSGGKPIAWDAVDRFVLDEDGLATERISYFDSMPVALAAATRPRAWPALLRSRLRR